MSAPKVSVILPAFNAVGFIQNAISSVLQQSLNDLELIIVDDGSTDGTFEVVAKVADPRVRCFRKENGGVASARNLGLKRSVGQYIAYCDHDDAYKQDHLRLLSDHLDDHPDVGLVYSQMLIIAQNKKNTKKWGGRFDQNKFEYDCLVSPLIAMHRRECVDKAGFWDEDRALRYIGEDWDFFLRISDSYKVAFIPQVTAMRHERDEGVLLKSLKDLSYFIGFTYLLKKRQRYHKTTPFDGYYSHIFLVCHRLAVLANKFSGAERVDVYQNKVAPLFEELARDNKNNLEIWLLLTLLYLSVDRYAEALRSARKAEGLLGQKLDLDDKTTKLIISVLERASLEFRKKDENDLAEKFLKKAKEFPQA